MLALLYSVALFFGASSAILDPLVVLTTGGLFRGFYSTSNSGRRYMSFAGIPFARPPVGNLRFRPPQPPPPWLQTRTSVEPVPTCVQLNILSNSSTVQGQEDCLYLSVHTHSKIGRRPVMVYIHGGAFLMGASLPSDRYQFLMDGCQRDFVIVAIQYRLGIMGFLSFEDEDMPGNNGLKDQAMALRWVRNNIARFGGDPGRVTLVGESAGGASVYLHTLSPLSKGLFHRGIAESGAGYSQWNVLPPGLARTNARRLALLASCPQSDTASSVACLRNRSDVELLNHLRSFREWLYFPILLFMPVMEARNRGAFLTGPMSAWSHDPVPLLMGMTSGEGLLFTLTFLAAGVDLQEYDAEYHHLGPMTLMYQSSATDPAQVTAQIREFYFGDRNITMAEWRNLTNSFADAYFTAGLTRSADSHPGEVYFYFFDYLMEAPPPQLNVDRNIVYAPVHVEEIIYLYSADLLSSNNDLAMSRDLIEIWCKFITTGAATSPSNDTWTKWTPGTHSFLHIDNTGFAVEDSFLEERVQFWSGLAYMDRYN